MAISRVDGYGPDAEASPASLWTIVLNWNRRDDLLACLDTLIGQTLPEGFQQHVLVVDNGSIDGSVEREREWDSCYSLEFSRVGSAPVRSTITSRYRQWLTHKFDTWHEQFGSSGCVGCGRCITWCPVGIDVTEAVERVRRAPEAVPC